MSKPHATATGDAAPPPPLTDRDSRLIPGLSGYRACDAGHIWSIRLRHNPGLIDDISSYYPLISTLSRGGYPRIRLRCPGHRNGRTFFVHRLVLESFVGPRPKGFQCRHLNGIKTDNRPSNLVWGTSLENHQDRKTHGTGPQGSANGSAKLTEDDVLKILELHAAGITPRAIQARFQVSDATIGKIINGTLWRHIPRTDGGGR